MEWCPGVIRYDKSMMDAAKAAVDAALARSTAGVIEAFEEVRKDWREDGDDFLRAVVQVLASRTESDRFVLWSSMRPILMYEGVPCDEALAGFLL